MLPSTLAKVGRPLVQQTQRRTYVGWLKKNKFIEEWNGRREITEKTWRAKWSNLHMFALWGIGTPGAIYFWTRSEAMNKGDRRYADVL